MKYPAVQVVQTVRVQTAQFATTVVQSVQPPAFAVTIYPAAQVVQVVTEAQIEQFATVSVHKVQSSVARKYPAEHSVQAVVEVHLAQFVSQTTQKVPFK